MSQYFKTAMRPVARADALLFVLGSLPGDASLAAQRYYAHPTNQFWRLLGGAIGEDLQALDYPLRLQRLAERRIGLWDVVAAAERRGSLDQAIRNAAHNPIAQLRRDYPDLRAVAFNGQAAASAGRKLLGESPRIELIALPSSSAANTTPVAAKAEQWRRLGEFCQAGFSAGPKSPRQAP